MKVTGVCFDGNFKWAQKLSQELSSHDIDLICETDPLKMIEVLELNQINFSLINASDDIGFALELIKEIKTTYLGINVFVILNDNDLIQTGRFSLEKFGKIGVSNILIKPFHINKLLSTLSDTNSLSKIVDLSHIREDQGDIEIESNDDDFSKIEIKKFLPDQSVLFNIYSRLEVGRYIKILEAGGSLDKETIDKYLTENKIEYFYIEKKDRAKYVEYCNGLLGEISKSDTATTTQKIVISSDVVNTYLENVYMEGIDEQTVIQGKEICNNIYNVIHKDGDLQEQLNLLSELVPGLYNHSFIVTFLASIIASQFPWDSKLSAETISMAAMLHDLGKNKLPKELILKNTLLMTPDELKQYKKHSIWGASELSTHKIINPTVAQIVAQHHEYTDGSGYPYGLRKEKILIFSRIICFSNDISHLMTDKKISPTEALKLLFSDPNVTERYDSDVVSYFMKILALDDANLKKTS